MNTRVLYFLCLLSGFLFLTGNLIYSLYKSDTVDLTDLFFLPMALMILVLWITVAEMIRNKKGYEYTRTIVCFFRNMSIGMCSHYFLSDSRLNSIIDFTFLVVCPCILIYNLLTVKK